MGMKHWNSTWFSIEMFVWLVFRSKKMRTKCINCACNAKSMQKKQKVSHKNIEKPNIANNNTNQRKSNKRKKQLCEQASNIIYEHLSYFNQLYDLECRTYIHMTYCARSISDSNMMMLVLFWFCWLTTTKLGPNSNKIANKKHRKYTTENIKN